MQTHAQAAYLAGCIACELEERGYAGADGFTGPALGNCSRNPDKLPVFFRHALPKASGDDAIAQMMGEFDPPPGPYTSGVDACFWIGYYHQKIARALPAAFSDRLSALIESAGLSVSAFAKAHGFPQQTIQNYVAGTRRPTWDMVQQLAKALGVTTDTFRDQ
jgi:DNA-binding XRE family transcriptional regulator